MSYADYKAWDGRLRQFADAVFAGLERAGLCGDALEQSAINFIGNPERFAEQSYSWAIEFIRVQCMGGFFTFTEAAEELGFDEGYFRGLVEKKEVHTFRFGDKDLFSALEIAALNRKPVRFAYSFVEALAKLRVAYPECDADQLKRQIAEGEIRAFRGSGKEVLVDRGAIGRLIARKK